MKTTIKKIYHRGSYRIGVFLEYGDAHIKYFREIDGALWSSTKKCWHLPYNKNSIEKLKQIFPELLKKTEVKELSHLQEKALIKFREWMRQKRYSESTIKTYVSLIKIFILFYNDKSLSDIGEEDVIEFNQNYILKNKFSASTQNQFVNAIKLFYSRMSNRFLDLENLERPQRYRNLPEVLSDKEVKCIINSFSNIKHKTLISLIYSAGLRIGEALNLKLKDIDSKRIMIYINQAKGRKIVMFHFLLFY